MMDILARLKLGQEVSGIREDCWPAAVFGAYTGVLARTVAFDDGLSKAESDTARDGVVMVLKLLGRSEAWSLAIIIVLFI